LFGARGEVGWPGEVNCTSFGIVTEVGGGEKLVTSVVEEEMGKEREIKLRIEDLPGLRSRLAKLGARVVRPACMNVTHFSIRLRVRWRVASSCCAFERSCRWAETQNRPCERWSRSNARSLSPAKNWERHKVREEIELEVSDAKALATIFEGLGMSRWFQYEKFRTTFRLPASNAWAAGLLIELDETPIGVFLELEGPANAIDRAAKALGFKKRDYILANYMVLYREDCRRRGKAPRDMLFAARQNGKRAARSKKRKLFS
jgi:adenylate cyclase class IV